MLKFRLQKGSKRLLLIMPMVALAILASGYLYFQSINRSEDPRVLSARKKFAQYDRMLRDDQFTRALAMLDEIEDIYHQTPGYQNSFELGVIENNRAGIYLVQVETARLSQENPTAALLESDLRTALKHTQHAIDIYNNWLMVHESLDRRQIADQVRPYFMPHDEAFNGRNLEKIIGKRVDDMVAAIEEMPRRLSVTYTNLGLIARYQGQADASRRHYEKAISMWPLNHVARNNLNMLLGRPLERPSFIRELFPPDRNDRRGSQ